MIHKFFAAVAICLIPVSGAWAQDPTIPHVLISELQAGQYNVGLDGVIANIVEGDTGARARGECSGRVVRATIVVVDPSGCGG